MSSSWIRVQDRKRNLVAAGSTACFYAIAFLGLWLVGSLVPARLASVPSTILVDLGGAQGPPGGIPLGLSNAPNRPKGAPAGAAPLPGPGATGPRAASKAGPTAAQNAAAAQAAQEDAALRAAAATAEAPPAPPKTRTFGSSTSTASGPVSSGPVSSGAPVTSGGSGSEPGVSGGTGSVTFRGSEMGNEMALTFGGSSGLVGRNLYVDIYRYMPLPTKIDDAIFRNISAKETFRSYYQQSGSEWRLKAPVALSQRENIWYMLEAAGYDASMADFKTANKLTPVVLEFAVGPLAKNKVELVDVRVITSSGSSEIDEAVVFGFRQASFFNKTGNAVGGRFVYGF